MNALPLRRVLAGVLLALLLGGPVGPLGAVHVAHVAPPVDMGHGPTLGGPEGASGHNGRGCAVCHLLSALRWTPTPHVTLALVESGRLQPLAWTKPSPLAWFGDSRSSRAPPHS